MAPEFVSFLWTILFFIELVIHKGIYIAKLVIASLMIKNETATKNYYHGTIP